MKRRKSTYTAEPQPATPAGTVQPAAAIRAVTARDQTASTKLDARNQPAARTTGYDAARAAFGVVLAAFAIAGTKAASEGGYIAVRRSALPRSFLPRRTVLHAPARRSTAWTRILYNQRESGRKIMSQARLPTTPPASIIRQRLVGATLLDANGGQPVADAGLIIDGDRVIYACPRRAVPDPDDLGATTVDLTGKSQYWRRYPGRTAGQGPHGLAGPRHSAHPAGRMTWRKGSQPMSFIQEGAFLPDLVALRRNLRDMPEGGLDQPAVPVQPPFSELATELVG